MKTNDNFPKLKSNMNTWIQKSQEKKKAEQTPKIYIHLGIYSKY